MTVVHETMITTPARPSLAVGVVSVIIPAHNEGRVIGRLLRAILDDRTARQDTLEVIVVCNACTDNTAAVARSFGDRVRVIETDVASKVNALNLGDRAATGFPRAYVDGDVVLTADSLWRMVDHLRLGRGLATAPAVRWDLGGASHAVRAFYAIDGRLPSSREGIGGTGVYVLSEEGRRRFGEFPRITGDDSFVRGHFSPDERRTTDGAYSVVTPPRTLAGVITIKTRSHYGNFELAPHLAHLNRGRGPRNGPVLRRLMLRPTLWPALAVYGYAKLVAKARARAQIRRGRAPQWNRDETSRTGSVPTAAPVNASDSRAVHAPAG